MAEAHEVNRVFLLYLEEGGELGILHDLAVARSIADTYRRLSPPDPVELVEATYDDLPPSLGGMKLGYDIADGLNNSLIAGSVDTDGHASISEQEASIASALREMDNCYRSGVNDNGLFRDHERASFYLERAELIRRRIPTFFESGDYKVVGLWLIDQHSEPS